uniref:Uncharacterized protein n=1 Tax=Cannabis sativa TaxID=3483 RepID=A0A803QHI5_CANSA
MSKDEALVARAREGSLFANEIDRMVQELAEPMTVEVHDSEYTMSDQGYLLYSRHASDSEVEEMGEDFELPDHETEDDEEGEGIEIDSVDNAQLNEPFYCKDLVSRVKKSDLSTFARLNLVHTATSKPLPTHRPHLPFTNPAIIPT